MLTTSQCERRQTGPAQCECRGKAVDECEGWCMLQFSGPAYGGGKTNVVLLIPYIWKSGGRLVQWSKSGVTWTQDQVCEGRKRESRSRKGLGITDGKLTWNLGNE